MNLLELQRRMAEDVMRPLTAEYQMSPTTEDDRPTADLIASYIKPNDRLSSFERLEIYNRQYWFRIIEAVSVDYPALSAVLGSESVDELVLAYLRDNPSTSFTLRNLGLKMPEWIRLHPEYTGDSHALAIDVVDLEWAYVEAFDRATLPPVDAAGLSEFTLDSTLRLQPHLQLLDLKFPVDELVLAVHRESEPTDIMSNAMSERNGTTYDALPEMEQQEIQLAVHRFQNSVYYRRIDKEEFRLLSALQAGETLGVALETAFQASELSTDEQLVKVQECFAHAAQLGWFCEATED
jgi:hypothetical protein